MPFHDDSVVEPSKAFLYTAPVGSAAPTKAILDDFDQDNPDDLGTGMTVWKHAGHTDLDDDFNADEDGGDSETRGTRQVPNLRERVEAVTEYIEINLVQFDDDSLTLYYGGGTTGDGYFDSTDSPAAVDYATFIVYCDGPTRRVAEYHPKTSIRRNGPVNREADGFLKMPIRLTPLKLAGQPVTRWFGDTFEADPEDG